MPITDSHDTGSLFVGHAHLEIGSKVWIVGEPRPRTVTYLMGSERRGWWACFKGQGAVPQGTVEWYVVEHEAKADIGAPNLVVDIAHDQKPTRTRRPNPNVGRLSFPRLEERAEAVVIGYDSAWTRRNRGAICVIRVQNGSLLFDAPISAGFDTALDAVHSYAEITALQIIAIDQPLIVPNDIGRRPVDKAVAPSVARRGGAVQPANRSRAGMFDANAPIWEFLAQSNAATDPILSIDAGSGVYAVEVFPALAIVGLLPGLFDLNRLPKYNPDRPTFRLDDWRLLCRELARLCEDMGIQGGVTWCYDAAALTRPRKSDQDQLDSVICALCGHRWWQRGLDASLVVGDTTDGYMVVPVQPALASEHFSDAERYGVPIISTSARVYEPTKFAR